MFLLVTGADVIMPRLSILDETPGERGVDVEGALEPESEETGSGSTGETLENGLSEGIMLARLGVEEDGKDVI